MRRVLLSILLLALAGPLTAQNVRVPNKDGSVKFAVLGDTGTGGSEQVTVGRQLAGVRSRLPFDFAILLGDNLYGRENPRDYNRKFEVPYKPLLDAGVKFYASLGNHDDPNQRMYKHFNMNGERYYTFKPSLTNPVRFFALDSNYMDPAQLEWLEKELDGSGSDWKIAFFHHPPYASGMHGSDEILKGKLEPLFIKYGVNVVFTGHEHFYERIKPQKGIQYFVMGNSAKLRRGDISPTGLTAFGYDNGYAFMIVEVDGDQMFFEAINEAGKTIDSGVITKSATTNRVIGTTGAAGAPAPKPAAKPAVPSPKPATTPSRTEEIPAPAPQRRERSGIFDWIF
jgi:predicted MPP superfamily phosphohydrolase